MPYIADTIYDNGLVYAQTNGTRLDICSTEPTNYTDAVTVGGATGKSLGNKTGLVVGAPQNGVTVGRRVVIPAISDGTVTVPSGTAAAFYALTDGIGELLVTGALDLTQVVTSPNAFTLTAINVTIGDATQV